MPSLSKVERLLRRKKRATHTMPRLEVMETRQLLALVSWVTNGDGFWDVGSNWSNGVGPSPTDEVQINRPVALTVTYRGLGTDSVVGIRNSETLDIQSGTLHLRGGVYSGSGTTRIDSGATLDLAGPGDIRLSQQTIRNHGTVIWTGGNLVQASGNTVIINEIDGMFDVRTDADARTESSVLFFENRGILRKSAGAEEATLMPVGSQFTNTGVVEAQVGTLGFDSAYVQLGSNATETRLQGGALRFGAGSSFQAGVLTGDGTITGDVVNVQADVTPGGSQVGTITIVGNFTQQDGTLLDPARLVIDMNGTTPGIDLDQLIVKADALGVGGNLVLGGTLEIVTNGFTPVLGQRFPIINGTTSVTGAFAQTVLPPIPPDQYWLVDEQPSGVTLEIVDTLADLALQATASASAVSVGQSLVVRVSVTNSGPNGADSVVVSDPLPLTLDFDPTTSSGNVVYDPATRTVSFSRSFLPVGQQVNASIGLRPNASAAGATITNTITVRSNTPDPNRANDSVTITTTVQASVNLVVDLTGPAQLAVGTPAPFNINVRNTGPNTATGVQVLFVLPVNTVLDPSASTPGFTFLSSFGGYIVSVPDLVPGASTTVTAVISPTVAARGPLLTSTAAATANETVLNPLSAVDSVTSTLLVAPQVVRLARYGAAPGRAFIVLTFDQDMNVGSVENTLNYRVVLPGRDGRFDTRDDVRVPVTAATYDATKRSVVLALGRRLGVYTRGRITVSAQAGGVQDAAGVLLAGNGSGLPGQNYVSTFGHGVYRGPLLNFVRQARVRSRHFATA